jgi:hypothetical protein
MRYYYNNLCISIFVQITLLYCSCNNLNTFDRRVSFCSCVDFDVQAKGQVLPLVARERHGEELDTDGGEELDTDDGERTATQLTADSNSYLSENECTVPASTIHFHLVAADLRASGCRCAAALVPLVEADRGKHDFSARQTTVPGPLPRCSFVTCGGFYRH